MNLKIEEPEGSTRVHPAPTQPASEAVVAEEVAPTTVTEEDIDELKL